MNSENKDGLEYAFRYFDLHAKQRMTVFNFFLAISGVLVGLIAASLSGDDKYPLAGLALSIFLLTLSYIFWQLDIRTSFLIKHAERALEISERELFSKRFRLVSEEDNEFQIFQKSKRGLAKGISYSRALRAIFLLMASLSVIGMTMSIIEIFDINLAGLASEIGQLWGRVCLI